MQWSDGGLPLIWIAPAVRLCHESSWSLGRIGVESMACSELSGVNSFAFTQRKSLVSTVRLSLQSSHGDGDFCSAAPLLLQQSVAHELTCFGGAGSASQAQLAVKKSSMQTQYPSTGCCRVMIIVITSSSTVADALRNILCVINKLCELSCQI